MSSKPSKSANATEAPTSGVTEAALQAKLQGPVGLGQDGVDFVNLMAQYFAVHGDLMPLNVAVDDYGFTFDEFVELIRNPMVQAALKEREVPLRDSILRGYEVVDQDLTLTNPEAVGAANNVIPEVSAPAPNWKEKTLSPIQLIAVNTMLDLVDTRSEKKKLQDLGISTQQWQMWLRDPTFSNYLHTRAENLLGDHSHEAHLALIDKIRMGDINAIKYYNEMTGKYVAQTSSGTGTTQLTDFKQLLIRILEIINDEVDDQRVAFNIAERFKALINAQHMADQLTEQQIVKPEIAPARELSPRLQSFVDKGAGK
jgi:putative insertion element HTH domain-containing protein